MAKRAGYVVKTPTGFIGYVYHDEGLVNGKYIVHTTENTKLLCDPDKCKIIGYLN